MVSRSFPDGLLAKADANKHKCAPLYYFWVYAFDPNGKFRIAWDTAILALVLVSCMKDPYETAFKLEGQVSVNAIWRRCL